VGTVGSAFRYVEKKTCKFAAQAGRVAGIPNAMGAGFAEIGLIVESLTSSSSTLRCSCDWGRLVRIMMQFSHTGGRKEKDQHCTFARQRDLSSLTQVRQFSEEVALK